VWFRDVRESGGSSLSAAGRLLQERTLPFRRIPVRDEWILPLRLLSMWRVDCSLARWQLGFVFFGSGSCLPSWFPIAGLPPSAAVCLGSQTGVAI
jgi:hypothetical protein